MVTKLRLLDREVRSIISSILTVADKHKISIHEIAVFGSRTDFSKKGGDIDLYIQIQGGKEISLRTLKREFRFTLEESLGAQKIDLVLDNGQVDLGGFGAVINSSKVIVWSKNNSQNS